MSARLFSSMVTSRLDRFPAGWRRTLMVRYAAVLDVVVVRVPLFIGTLAAAWVACAIGLLLVAAFMAVMLIFMAIVFALWPPVMAAVWAFVPRREPSPPDAGFDIDRPPSFPPRLPLYRGYSRGDV